MKAIDQMEAVSQTVLSIRSHGFGLSVPKAYSTLLHRTVAAGEGFSEKTRRFSLDGEEHPRIVSLGGDHTIVSLSTQPPAVTLLMFHS